MTTSHKNGGHIVSISYDLGGSSGCNPFGTPGGTTFKEWHTTAWMSVTPNPGLGQKLDGRDYRYLIKWWLGRPLVTNGATRCPCCEGARDAFGDHLVSCKFNQPVQRHNALRDALADELQSLVSRA